MGKFYANKRIHAGSAEPCSKNTDVRNDFNVSIPDTLKEQALALHTDSLVTASIEPLQQPERHESQKKFTPIKETCELTDTCVAIRANKEQATKPAMPSPKICWHHPSDGEIIAAILIFFFGPALFFGVLTFFISWIWLYGLFAFHLALWVSLWVFLSQLVIMALFMI